MPTKAQILEDLHANDLNIIELIDILRVKIGEDRKAWDALIAQEALNNNAFQHYELQVAADLSPEDIRKNLNKARAIIEKQRNVLIASMKKSIFDLGQTLRGRQIRRSRLIDQIELLNKEEKPAEIVEVVEVEEVQ